MKGTKKALLCLLGGIMSVSLATAVAISLPTNAQASATVTPVFSEDFEDGTLGNFAKSGNGVTSVVTETAELDCAYTGTYAMQSTYQWSRNTKIGGSWIQQGDFFEISVWAKAVADSVTAKAVIKNWYGGYKGYTEYVVIPNTNVIKGADWVQLSGVFGLYSDGTKFYAYHNGGILEEITANAGYSIDQQVYLDIGGTSSTKSIYYDDIVISKSSVAKDVTVTVLYGETEVSGATFVVYDSDGVALTTQPEVVEENGVYTLQGVPFDNFASKYTVKAYVDGALKGSGTVSYLESETTISSAIYYEDFEDVEVTETAVGDFKNYNNGKTALSAAAYTGAQAMQVNNNSARNTTLGGAWIQQGDFFELNFWAKNTTPNAGEDGYSRVITKLYYHYGTWGTLTLFPGNTAASSVYVRDGWKNFSATFGVYSDGTNFYVYQDGTCDTVAAAAGKSVNTSAILEFGSNSGSLYTTYDDIMITKTTVTKDVTVSAFDGNTGGALTGATLTLTDNTGAAVAIEPTENNGVYTFSGLSFGNFAQEYTVKVEKDGKTQTGVATFVNSAITITTPEDETELKISASNGTFEYEATIGSNDGATGIVVAFDTAKTFEVDENLSGGVTFFGSDGTEQTVSGTWLGDNKAFFTAGEAYAPAIGDRFVFAQGFALKGNEILQETVSLMVVDTAENAQLATTPEVNDVSITLNGKIGLNFKFMLENGFVAQDSTFKVVYKKGETVLSEETLAGKTATNGKYSCSYPVIPKDYQVDITAQLQDGNGNPLLSATYSVEKYVEKARTCFAEGTPIRTLVDKTEAYCEAARLHFAEATVAKDETVVDLSGHVPVVENVSNLPTTITNLTVSLLLEAGTELRVYIEGSLDGVICYVNGVEQTLSYSEEKGKWYVSLEDVASNELEDMVEFKFIKDGENTENPFTLKYSALCYGNTVLNNTNSSNSLINVVKAMYAYSEATKAYVQSLEG